MPRDIAGGHRRGPIWAPSAVLMEYGLHEAGHRVLVSERTGTGYGSYILAVSSYPLHANAAELLNQSGQDRRIRLQSPKSHGIRLRGHGKGEFVELLCTAGHGNNFVHVLFVEAGSVDD